MSCFSDSRSDIVTVAAAAVSVGLFDADVAAYSDKFSCPVKDWNLLLQHVRNFSVKQTRQKQKLEFNLMPETQ